MRLIRKLLSTGILLLTLLLPAQAQRIASPTHLVRPGETLGLIAEFYDVDVNSLASLNGIGNSHLIYSWQELTIPADESAAAPSNPADAAHHIVQRGETLDGIAKSYDIPLSELIALNGVASRFIYPGQQLALSNTGRAPQTTTSTPLVNPTVSPIVEGGTTTHIVRYGETLGQIAATHDIGVFELQSLNNLYSDLIYVGQVLQLTGSAQPLAADAQPPSTPLSGDTHIVQAGETMAIIADNYGVNLVDLQAANNLWTWLIYVGQELVIPAGGTAPETIASPPSPAPITQPSDAANQQPSVAVSDIKHIVQYGETLAIIAANYGVDLADLQAVNDNLTWLIYVGQELAIPEGGHAPTANANPPVTAPATQQPTPASRPDTYIVQPGDTLFRIAKDHDVSIDALMRANGIEDATRIHSGLELRVANLDAYVPPPAPSTANPASTPATAPTSPVPTGGRQQYTVQRGEFLSQIGAKLGVSWLAIVEVNRIANPDSLKVGTVLLVPTAEEAARYGPVNSNAYNFRTSNNHPGARVGVGREIVVVLNTQTAYAYENGVLQKRALISSGLPKSPTVTGNFAVKRKVRSQSMTGPDYDLDNVEWVMYFYSGYALHGTYWHYNFGQRMSHGCVNMTNADAKWFYDFAPVGTPVTVRFY